MSTLTTNYNLHKPESADNAITAMVTNLGSDMEAIDSALTPTADPATENVTTNGPFKLVKWVSLFAKLIKAITGKTNWYTAPSKSLEDFNNHLDETTPHTETTGRIITVGIGKNFTTIQAAINSSKKKVDAVITINVDAGTYNEDIRLHGFIGSGEINIMGATYDTDTHKLRSFEALNCSCKIKLFGFSGTTTVVDCFTFKGCSHASLNSCNTVCSASSINAVTASYSILSVANSTFDNHNKGIEANSCSIVYSNNNEGSGNTYGLYAIQASTIGKNSYQPEGTTNEYTAFGGEIR